MKKAVFSLILLAIFLPSFAFGESQQTKLQVKVDSPRIDDEAASIVKNKKGEIVEERGIKTEPPKADEKYPENFWVFILGAYVFVLIFNLSFNFSKAREAQWFWESVYTFLAIFTWDQLDVARINPWFPKLVMETGIIIYVFYFYFLKKKNNLGFENEKFQYPRQEKLL